VNENRRKFIKLVLIGGGTILVGKVFSPLLLRFLDSSSTKTQPTAKTNSGDFQVVENKNRFSIYDNSGEEIFQIDNEA